MTCGFMNSAGTDLDSLFLINNSNGGALGFQCSNGQDLGNRFSASSQLNYAVGFQNSAGTDIGYLRGAGAVPVMGGYSFTMNALYNSGRTSCSHGSGEDSWSHKQRYMRGYVTVVGNCSGFGNLAPTWQVCICYYHVENGHNHLYATNFIGDSTAQISPALCLFYSTTRLAPNTDGPWVTVKNNAGGASRSMNVAFGIYSNDGSGGNSYGNRVRVYQRFYNGAGSTPWVSQILSLGD